MLQPEEKLREREEKREKSSLSEERMKEKSVSFVGFTIFLERVKKKNLLANEGERTE